MLVDDCLSKLRASSSINTFTVYNFDPLGGTVQPPGPRVRCHIVNDVFIDPVPVKLTVSPSYPSDTQLSLDCPRPRRILLLPQFRVFDVSVPHVVVNSAPVVAARAR